MTKVITTTDLKKRIVELEEENEALKTENVELREVIENVYDNVAGFIEDEE